MGIPTLGTSLDPKIPSRVNYILSINTIKTWLSSLGGNYSVSANNYSNLGNYLSSSVKIEDINLSSLRALDAPTPVEIISGNLDVWINPDKSKSTELKEKIQGLQKGDKVKVTGFDSNDGKFYYTDIEKIEQPKIEEAIEPEEIILGGKDE